MAMNLLDFFEHNGFVSVERAANLAQALDLLAGNCYCVVILDLMLPNGIGVEVIRAVRRVAPNSAVVVLTGCPDLELDALDAGAEEFLGKGEYSWEGLKCAMVRALVRKRLWPKFQPLAQAIESYEKKLEAAKEAMNILAGSKDA